LNTLVFFLEELSARVMLEGIIHRLLPPDIIVRYVVFDGKNDLEEQLPRKLRGWVAKNTAFIVLRDQDQSDCYKVKMKLKEICDDSSHPETIVRIACRELESFYFGDLASVGEALGIESIERYQYKAK